MSRPGAHRWVLEEPCIPFDLDILYEDEHIIVIDKPHFLATTPRGMWYRQTALMRLRQRFDEPQITPAHRLDRMTAGVVLFVRDPTARGAYQMLFERHRVTKTYECLAACVPVARPHYGTVRRLRPPAVFPLLRRSHIVKERGVIQAYESPGEANAQTIIDLAAAQSCSWKQPRGANGVGQRPRRYELHPLTGKTHQLRVHMNSLGLPILGDDCYPTLVERDYEDFSQPLALVARSLEFVDPFSAQVMRFTSRITL